MTRGGTRSIAVLAATALVVMLLAACGSSDSGSSDSSSTGSSTTETDNGSGGGTQGENDAGSTAQQKQSSDEESSSTGFTAEEVETPLKVSGGGSEQFRVKGGDNSVQEFGEESDESELQEAAEVVHSFFVARAENDWASACTYLSKSMQEQLEQLAASSTELKDKGCASFLEAFTGKLSAPAWRKTTAVDAGSLRRDDEQAFLIYYGEPDKTVFAMPLAREDDTFKVGALGGNPLN